MNRKQKKILWRIVITCLTILPLNFIPMPDFFKMILSLSVYLIIGYDILKKAFMGIIRGQFWNENFLMSTATLGAIAIALQSGSNDYFEAIAVMLFYQIGELFQSVAVGKSRRSITALMDIRPDYANIESGGNLIKISPSEIEIGSIIVVQTGEKIPIDGIVTDGFAQINTSALTGESLPINVSVGNEVISGCVNMNGLLKIRTTKLFGESTVSKILELVEESSSRKSKSENFISKFAKYYTPAVCIFALLLAVAPPLLNLITHNPTDFAKWVYRALTFLVISCPCALVISIPLTFFAGIGGASREGILVKGSNYLEALSKVKTVVFDKTGTLTKGVFEVSHIHRIGISESSLIEYAALAESASSHPISVSLRKAYGKEICRERVSDIKEISGQGVTASVDGYRVAVGNIRLMELCGVTPDTPTLSGTTVHISINGQYSGYIVISDKIKNDAQEAISSLKSAGINRIIMLTGDSDSVAKEVSESIGITEVYAKLLPSDKVTIIEEILSAQESRDKLVFAGDGINDAPVLSRADIGIAMGAIGSDAAIEAADVVIMDDNPNKVATAVEIANKCMSIVYQNIFFALGIKFSCLILGAFGIADMWLAIFADVGVMVIAVLNSMRALNIKKHQKKA